MAEIKGVKKLNNAISKQLIPFGLTKARLSDEYSFIYVKETVTYKITEKEYEDEWFKEFVLDRFGYEIKYPFIFSILHEVGHYKANDDIDGEVYQFCLDEKERITREMEKSDRLKECEKLEYQYFNLPDEIMATWWAVNYAKKHPQEIEMMWNECKNALNEFYIANNITE